MKQVATRMELTEEQQRRLNHYASAIEETLFPEMTLLEVGALLIRLSTGWITGSLKSAPEAATEESLVETLRVSILATLAKNAGRVFPSETPTSGENAPPELREDYRLPPLDLQQKRYLTPAQLADATQAANQIAQQHFRGSSPVRMCAILIVLAMIWMRAALRSMPGESTVERLAESLRASIVLTWNLNAEKRDS